MSSFNRSGCLWTGGDKNLSINILQKEWGFKGYSITDRAVSNGGTYRVYDDGYRGGTNLFMGSANDLKDYKNNAAFCQMVRDSAKRILYTIANKSWARNGFLNDTIAKCSIDRDREQAKKREKVSVCLKFPDANASGQTYQTKFIKVSYQFINSNGQD